MALSGAGAINFPRAAGSAQAQDIKKHRTCFDDAVAKGIEAIGEHCYMEFVSSDHFPYVLELKAKEGIVANVPDFRLLSVLGEGGFGQVCEVIKRDCGKRYAMKIMRKVVDKRERPPVPAGMPDDVRALVGKCWAPAPDDRPDFAAITQRLHAPRSPPPVPPATTGQGTTKPLA